MILDDIYQCAQNGGGTFAAVFPGKITQAECQAMITYLSKNKIGQLLDATPAGRHPDRPQTRLGGGNGWGHSHHAGRGHHFCPRWELYRGGRHVSTHPIDLRRR